MARKCVAEAATVPEALDKALEELGVQQDAVDYIVLEEGGKKHFLGGSKLAKVEVTIHEDVKAVADSLVHEILDDDEPTGTERMASANLIDAEDLTDEQVDAIADAAIEVVTRIAEYCGAQDFEVEEYEGEEGELILDLVGGDLAFLIGRHGRTLDALQTVAAAMVTKKMGIRYPVTIDVEGYRHRRRMKLIEIGQHAADRAKRTGRPVPLRPMNPQERRIVHIAMREMKGVTSNSEGVGDNRHVVISPVK